MNSNHPLARFDPARLAHFEKENWVAYYQKRWMTLLRVSVAMVREAFALTPFAAFYAAVLLARAEIAAAPFPDNDIPTAEGYMRRFYALISRVHHLELDIEQAARLEVNWWVVHRRLAGKTQNQELIDALAEMLVHVYGIDRQSAYPVAVHRAQAMLHSDRWVIEGRIDGSRLLEEEENELLKSYSALKSALAAG